MKTNIKNHQYVRECGKAPLLVAVSCVEAPPEMLILTRYITEADALLKTYIYTYILYIYT